jgi:integrase
VHIYKPKYPGRDGKYREAKNWAVSFRQKGKRVYKSLGTPNKRAAEVRARKLFERIEEKGWEEIKPKLPGARRLALSVLEGLYREYGENRRRPLRHRTIRDNFARLMRIARVLRATTVEELNGRTSKFLKDPGVARLTESSRAAIVRAAASIFRSDALLFYQEKGYTTTNPFEGSIPKAPEPTKFQGLPLSKIKGLINDAQAELKPNRPEAYAVFLMAMCAGLRAQEATWALKEHLVYDVENSRFGINVTSGAEHETKSGKSRFVPLPQSAVDELRSLPGKSRFIVQDIRRPRLREYNYKRAEAVLSQLAEWLRSKDITDRKPVHYLRKAFGAAVATKYGLYPAKEYLGHSSVRVTETIYADLLEKPVIDLTA